VCSLQDIEREHSTVEAGQGAVSDNVYVISGSIFGASDSKDVFGCSKSGVISFT
jgi:hypothetical protein